MTVTFIIGYIVSAVILVSLINLFVLKSRHKSKLNQSKGQQVNEESKSQNNPSKFKMSDLEQNNDAKNASSSQISEEKNVTLIMINLIIRKITISIMIKEKIILKKNKNNKIHLQNKFILSKSKRHIPYTTQMMNNAIRILKIQ